jgi:hypothetical protein
LAGEEQYIGQLSVEHLERVEPPNKEQGEKPFKLKIEEIQEETIIRVVKKQEGLFNKRKKEP